MPSALRPAARGLVLLAATVCTAVLAVPGSAGSAEPLRLTIAFTGDVSGYLEPCG
jgi:hypothetical protein